MTNLDAKTFDLLVRLTLRLTDQKIQDGKRVLIHHSDPDLIEAFAALGWENRCEVPTRG